MRYGLRTLFVAITLFCCLLGCIWVVRDYLSNRLTIINQSGQSIKRLSIRVGGGLTEFKNVPPGSTVTARFRIEGDDSFVVRGELADGTTIDGSYGYVTSGYFREQATFTIDANAEVIFEQSTR